MSHRDGEVKILGSERDHMAENIENVSTLKMH